MLRRIFWMMTVCSVGFAQGPAAPEGVVLNLGAGLELELVPIKAGTFYMGSDVGAADEHPIRKVTISRAFWLGRTEVTRQQYYHVMKGQPWPAGKKGGDLPQDQVNWKDAKAFCTKLTARERTAGRLPEGYEYALPTEAQWEYACRAGSRGKYAGDLESMGWFQDNSGGTAHPVGTKKPNKWGLYDMYGNVWEWCADRYESTYYERGGGIDPKNVWSGGTRVDRGGSWLATARGCRSANRNQEKDSCRSNTVGFRIGLVPVAK